VISNIHFKKSSIFSAITSQGLRKNLKTVSSDNLAANLHPDINSLRLMRTRIFCHRGMSGDNKRKMFSQNNKRN